jgi:Mak16 protein C-terminal region
MSTHFLSFQILCSAHIRPRTCGKRSRCRGAIWLPSRPSTRILLFGKLDRLSSRLRIIFSYRQLFSSHRRPNYLVHKNKQRLTKIVQYLIRMHKIEKAAEPAIVRELRLEYGKFVRRCTISPHPIDHAPLHPLRMHPPAFDRMEERRDVKNEDKALKAAKIEDNIERELLARLKQVRYFPCRFSLSLLPGA